MAIGICEACTSAIAGQGADWFKTLGKLIENFFDLA